MGPAAAPGMEAVFSCSATPRPHSTLHQANDVGGLLLTVTLFLGKPEQAKRAAPLFTASFLHHMYLPGTLSKQTTVPLHASSLCSQSPPRNWHQGLAVQGLGSPLFSLSINCLNPHGPPVQAT